MTGPLAEAAVPACDDGLAAPRVTEVDRRDEVALTGEREFEVVLGHADWCASLTQRRLEGVVARQPGRLQRPEVGGGHRVAMVEAGHASP